MSKHDKPEMTAVSAVIRKAWRPVRVALVGTDNTVGKTTLAKHCYAPQMGAQRWEFEALNHGDAEPDRRYKTKNFDEFATDIAVWRDTPVIVDIGASALQQALRALNSAPLAISAIDYWVFLMTPEGAEKQQRECMSLAKTLAELGVGNTQFVFMFNKVVDPDDVELDFREVMKARKLGSHVITQAVLSSPAYALLKDDKRTVFDVALEVHDFEAELEAAVRSGDEKRVLQVAHEAKNWGHADMASRNLRAVFQATPIAAAMARDA